MSGRTRVLVNLSWLVPGVVGGSEDSLTGALRAIRDQPTDDLDLHLAVLRPFLEAHPDLAEAYDCSVLGLDGSDKVRRVLAEQTWLARRTRQLGADVVHHAGGVVPLVHPGRVVLTVQDLQPLDLPQNFSLAKRTYIRAMIGRSVRAARTVCVPSLFTRDRVVDLLGADPGRVEVVPWFARPPADTQTSDTNTGETNTGETNTSDTSTSALAADAPYLLYPAITYPHKNHLVLLDAFALVARAVPEARLVLTGGEGSVEPLLRRRIDESDLRGRVVRTGRIAQPLLEDLYRGASGVVVPSRYEGFGLPVLEAMARDLPVLASRAGSLPEVARAQDLLDPDDVTAWSEAMQCVLGLSGPERSERVAAGRDLVAAFTPGATATGLLQAYRRAAAPTQP